MPKKGKGRTSRKRGKEQFKAGKEGEERNVEENPGKKALAAGKSGEGKGGEMREIREREKKGGGRVTLEAWGGGPSVGTPGK